MIYASARCSYRSMRRSSEYSRYFFGECGVLEQDMLVHRYDQSVVLKELLSLLIHIHLDPD